MSRHRELSPRQREIIRHVAKGCTDKEISGKLAISEGTLKNHFSRIFERLNARSRAHAVFLFFR